VDRGEMEQGGRESLSSRNAQRPRVRAAAGVNVADWMTPRGGGVVATTK
jgi:hypothetical protein